MKHLFKKLLISTTCIVFTAETAIANRYPNCIMPVNDVAIPIELDNIKNRDCLLKHFQEVKSAEAKFVTFDTHQAAINLTETAKSTATIVAAGNIPGLSGDLFAVVTAVGQPENTTQDKMGLSSGIGYKELSMVAANKNETGHTKFMEMGAGSASNLLKDWKFEALSDEDLGTEQHFHLIGIDC